MVPSALYLPTLTSHPHVPWQRRVLHPKICLKKDFKGRCLQKDPLRMPLLPMASSPLNFHLMGTVRAESGIYITVSHGNQSGSGPPL